MKKEARIKMLKRQHKALVDNKELAVSDHAILRYLERAEGIDTEEVKARILTAEVLEAFATLGGSFTYKTDQYKVVVKNSKVVTFVNLEE